MFLTSLAVPAPGQGTLSGSDSEDPDAFPDTDLEWMKDFLPRNIEPCSRSFFGTPVITCRQVLSMPTDYPPLLYLLKPALVGMPIATFTYREFLDAMGIDSLSGRLEKGNIECLQLVGPIEGIVDSIRSRNFAAIDSMAVMMRGRITLTDFDSIEASLFKSYPRGKPFLRSLIFDSRLEELEITLIMHIVPVNETIKPAPTIDADDVKVYDMKRKQKLR